MRSTILVQFSCMQVHLEGVFYKFAPVRLLPAPNPFELHRLPQASPHHSQVTPHASRSQAKGCAVHCSAWFKFVR